MLTGSLNGILILWDIKDVKRVRQLQTFSLDSGFATAVAFSFDENSLLIGSSQGEVILLNINTKKTLLRIKDYIYPICVVAYSSDGTLIIAGSKGMSSDSFTIRFWDTVTGERLLKHDEIYSGSTYAAALSPDGSTVLTGFDDGEARLCGTRASCAWSQRACKVTSTIIGSLIFSADGENLIAGSKDGVVSVWNTRTEEIMHQLKGHYGPITALALSPDGNYLATGSEDKAIRLWDASKNVI